MILCNRKQEVKPEPAKEEEKENQAPVQEEWNTETRQQTKTDGWNASSDDAWNEPVNTQPATTTTTTTDGWGAPSEPPISSSLDLSSEPTKEPENQAPAATEQDALAQKRQSTLRRLKQDAPVVLPNNSATLSAIGVKFGSLSLDDDNTKENVDINTVLQTETRLVLVPTRYFKQFTK